MSILICPLLLVVAAALVRQPRLLTRIAAALMVEQLVVVAVLFGPWLGVPQAQATVVGGFRLDGVTAFFLLLTTLVAAAALAHAVGFFDRELEGPHPPTGWGVAQLYLFTALFVLSMYAVVAADDLGYLWIGMEASTLLSAPLVYYHRSKTALEATWKYLIMCSVGIAFAFFGTAVLFAASQRVELLGEGTLSVQALAANAFRLPPEQLRFAYVFVLLGYGTKAGLFPLHSWLPDAHSEAPAPISAILSGALLNCALVALARVGMVMTAAGQQAFVLGTFLPMAALTVLAASLFLLKQGDLKRLWAYSSMENVGLMAIAVALGSTGAFAFQALNHSLAKVALFLLAGNVLQDFGTKRIRALHGLLGAQPLQGTLVLLAAFAVAGTPPFGSFLAEWRILQDAVDSRQFLVAAVVVGALATAFIAVSLQIGAVLMGPPPRRVASGSWRAAVVPLVLLAAALVLGVALPSQALEMLR